MTDAAPPANSRYLNTSGILGTLRKSKPKSSASSSSSSSSSATSSGGGDSTFVAEPTKKETKKKKEEEGEGEEEKKDKKKKEKKDKGKTKKKDKKDPKQQQERLYHSATIGRPENTGEQADEPQEGEENNDLKKKRKKKKERKKEEEKEEDVPSLSLRQRLRASASAIELVSPRFRKSPRKNENEDGPKQMSLSADSAAVPTSSSSEPQSPRSKFSLKGSGKKTKRSERRMSISQETKDLWNQSVSGPIPTSNPDRLRRNLSQSQSTESVSDKWKKNSGGSPTDKDGINKLREAYKARKSQILSSENKQMPPPPPPETAQRSRSATTFASAPRSSSVIMMQQARTSFDETDIKDKSSSRAKRAMNKLKRKSLATPMRDLKDFRAIDGFGNYSDDEEEAKTEVNILVLGDPIGAEGADLRSSLTDRYIDFVRPQRSVHVKSDLASTKLLELTFDNRPVVLKIVNFDESTDPLTLSTINVAIVLFSVVDQATLDNALTKWLPKVRSLSNTKPPAILVGAYADRRRDVTVSIPQDLAQGYAFAQTNECYAYFEIEGLTTPAAKLADIFNEAVAALVNPVQQREATIFVDSLRKGSVERLVLSHKNLTTASFACLVSPEERKAGLRNVRSLVLSHNFLTYIPRFVLEMTQLEELRLDNNKLLEIDPAIGEKLPNLRVLDLHNNEIPSLPTSLSRLQQLVELNLNGNPLEDEALLSPSVNFIRSYLSNPMEWTERGVQLWLDKLGMPRYKQIFYENDIDGEVLLSLEENELREYLSVADADVPLLLDAISALTSHTSAPSAI